MLSNHDRERLTDGSVFELAVKSAPSGILVCDEQGTIFFANHQIEKTFGYSESELVGRSVEELLPAQQPAGHRSPGEQFWQRAESWAMGAGRDLAGLRKDGSRVPVEVSVTVVSRNGGHLLVASVVDVTERLELQNHIHLKERERVAFERVVSELAARFVNLKPAEVNDAVVDSLRQLAEVLDLDRSTIWDFAGKPDDSAAVFSWTRPEFRVVSTGLSFKEQVPWILSHVLEGEVIAFSSVSEVPDPRDRDGLQRFGIKSSVVSPFTVGGALRGAVSFTTIRSERQWPPAVIERLRLVASVMGQALARRDSEEQLQSALSEVQRLRDQLALENRQLRREVRIPRPPRTIVAESSAARETLKQIDAVAATHATVLLLGETGCGKEVFAHASHRMSPRFQQPMVLVNCAAIPTTLIESELFGRERGAYTGALAKQIGRFELADRSTIFLDEIGDLPLEAQVKILRVLQDKVIERLGSSQAIKVDVRIIAATNRDLEKAVADKTFREDLYYRLNVFPVIVPPLRERAEDIPGLVWTFVDEYSRSFGKPVDSISKDSLAALQRYTWPGNVRELRNIVERALIVATGPRLTIEIPRSGAPEPESKGRPVRLKDLEAEHIKGVLESVGWRVRGLGGAAELLGVKPTTLDSRMVKLGIRRP
jgi:formate hydrogenlyase transcriptional activator